LVGDHFEEKDAQCPYINLIIIRFVLNHLWSHVFVGPAEGFARPEQSCEPEITELGMAPFSEQYIFRLKIIIIIL
jgi:hypothetical protein